MTNIVPENLVFIEQGVRDGCTYGVTVTTTEYDALIAQRRNEMEASRVPSDESWDLTETQVIDADEQAWRIKKTES
jgi:hypothetical protein